MLKKIKIVILLVFASIQHITAQEYPVISDMVTDNAAIFSVDEAQYLRQKLTAYEAKTSHEIVILTIDRLNGNSIESYAYSVFNQEGNSFGKKEIDNGLLILISRNDRKVRIEVGNGLEPIVTDALASRIIRNIITPNFKESNYFNGIDIATSQLIKLIDDPRYEQEFSNYYPEVEETSSSEVSNVTKFFVSLFLTVVYFLLGFYGYNKLVVKKGKRKIKIKQLYQDHKTKFLIYLGLGFCVILYFYTFSVSLLLGLIFVGFLSVFVAVGVLVILKMAFKFAISVFTNLFTGKLGILNFLFVFPFTLFPFFGGFAFTLMPLFFMGVAAIQLFFNNDINAILSSLTPLYFLGFIIVIYIVVYIISIWMAIKDIRGSQKLTFGFSFFKMAGSLSGLGGGGSSRGYSSSGSSSYSSSSSSSSSYSGGGGSSSGGGASGSW